MTSLARGFLATAVVAWATAARSAEVADKKALTLDGAKKVAAAAATEAARNNEGAAIAVVDDGGNLMYLERIDGTFAAGARISIGKARTAALFKKPTAAFEDIIKNGRTAMVALAAAGSALTTGGSMKLAGSMASKWGCPSRRTSAISAAPTGISRVTGAET